MQSCKGKFCFEEGNYLMQTSLIVIVVIAAVIAVAIAVPAEGPSFGIAPSGA